MLKASLARKLLSGQPARLTALFMAAIGTGAAAGAFVPGMSPVANTAIDPLILLLITWVLLELRVDGLGPLKRAPRLAALVWLANTLLVPAIAFALTSLLPTSDDALRIGLLIYCLFPCTDWFLGFVRLAGGDTAVGAALIPINLLTQFVLYPIYLPLFTGQSVSAMLTDAGPTLLTWFVGPAAVALILRVLLALLAAPARQEAVLARVSRTTPLVIAAMIFVLFAGHVEVLLARVGTVLPVLATVAGFFLATYVLSEGITRLARLEHPERALLTVTMSARNAPLMIAMTSVAFPDRPEITAVIVVGMLIEFPHLTVVTHLLAHARDRAHADTATAA